MSHQNLYVSTRKGLFALSRNSSDWRVERISFLAEPVTLFLADPRDGVQYAALNLGHFGVKIHRSEDGGQTWEECDPPSYPVPEGEEKGPSLFMIWELEAGGPDQPGVLWAGTIPGGLFKSSDHGKSWSIVESLWNRPEREKWFGGGYDQAGIHSVCVDPTDSRHVSVAVSCGGVWVTRDGGESWAVKTKGMFAEYMPPDQRDNPDIQDPHRMVLCRAKPSNHWVQHHNGIFRSTDDCETWSHVPNDNPSSFGFAVAVHPEDPDSAWFVPAVKDQTRVPAEARLVVTRTRDGGKTFEALSRGLPQGPAYDIVYRHALAVDDSGTTLAFGSTTGNLWISENGGDDWRCFSNNLPPINAVRFG